MTFTSSGWTFSNSSLSYLNNLANPARAELNIIGSWTNRYSAIQSVKSNAVTMAQPAWDQNTWGYDTVQSPYRQGPIYAENDYTLLDQPGEWYQDTTAGVLYYIPLARPGPDEGRRRAPAVAAAPRVGAACPSGFDERGRVRSAAGRQSHAGRGLRRSRGRRPLRAAGTRSRLQRPDVLAHQLARAEHRRIRRPADGRLSRRSQIELPGRRPDADVRGRAAALAADASRRPGVGGEEHLVRAGPVRRLSARSGWGSATTPARTRRASGSARTAST